MRLALVLGSALWLASCTAPVQRCTASTCMGCCDAAGACVPGTSSGACGSLGGQCRVCLSGELCNFGICTLQSLNGGGTGGGMGGGTTGGGTATGGGTTGGGTTGGGTTGGGTATGGGTTGGGTTGGGGGATGGGGSSCNQGNCGGCCNGNTCEAGNTLSFCGANGNACVQCGGGLTCQGGQCRAPPTCNASTCPNGCCNLTVCDPGITPTSCGTGGAQCLNCNGNACMNQQCVVPPTCNAQTCSNGCCAGNQCVSGTTQAQCGTGGQQCVTCVGNETCTNQACMGSGLLPTGAACTAASQCAGDLDPFFPTDCIQPRLSDGGLSGWTGGYCNATCFDFISMHDCPSPADYCDGFSCYQSCPAPNLGQSTCRVGYVCANTRLSDGGIEANSAHCIPNCNNAPAAVCGSRFCLPNGYCS